MNNRLAIVLDWASENGVDLDRANIDGGSAIGGCISLTFWQHREMVENFRAVKRAVGDFPSIEPRNESFNTSLTKEIEVGEYKIEVRWAGAYTCKRVNPEYNCKPTPFNTGETLEEIINDA